MSLTPVFDERGELAFMVDLQNDVTVMWDLEQLLVRRLQDKLKVMAPG